MMKLMLLLLVSVARAGELHYFDTKIDFWGKGEESVKTEIREPTVPEKFPWKTYLDPKNKEFFREGDYTPPEPFMEVARNPSDENLKSWFEFMNRKNELARRLDSRMQEYLAKNDAGLAAQVGAHVASAEVKVVSSQGPLDPARFHLRMYFSSTCPHCRKMFGVLKRLHDNGFEVEALQVDDEPVPEAEKIVPISRATPEELKKHKVQGVPYLLIADTKRQALLPPIEGFHEYEEVLALIKSAN